MSDTFDFINYMRLNDVDQGAKNAERLGDLRDRAAIIAKRTGEEPLSWYEFKQNEGAKTPPDILGNVLKSGAIGTLIGVAIGALIAPAALLTFAVYGAISGMIAGSFSDTANKRRHALESKYEQYLDGVEASVGRGKDVSQEVDTRKSNHVEELLASRQQTQLMER